MRPRPFKRNFFPPSGPKSITTLKAGPSHISRRLAIAVYKRSWRDIFRVNIGSRQRKQNLEKGRPVETAAAVEIGSGGLRQLLLDDFHKLLGKASAKPAPAFPQLPQRRRRYPSHLKNKRGQFFQRRLTLMAAVEIRKKRGFPQPQGNSKSTQHFFYSLRKFSRNWRGRCVRA